METGTGVMDSTFVVRSNESDDPGRCMLVAAREKIILNRSPNLTLLRQWPSVGVPSRLLVAGDWDALFTLVQEFFPIIQIEENYSIWIDVESDLSRYRSDDMPSKIEKPAKAAGERSSIKNHDASSVKLDDAVCDDGADQTMQPDATVAPSRLHPHDGNTRTSAASTAPGENGGHIELLVSAPMEFIFSPKASEGRAAVQMLNNPGNLINDLKTYSGLDIEIVRTRSRPRNAAAAASGASETSALLVRMDSDKGRMFAAQSLLPGSPLWVEENLPVRLFDGVSSPYFTTPEVAVVSDGGQAVSVDFRITGEGGIPLPMAIVKIFSSLSLKSVDASSDGNGIARFRLPRTFIATVTALVVEPQNGYWSKVFRRPPLRSGTTHEVQLASFREFDRGFDSHGASSWGVQALGIDTGTGLGGKGCKIAVIDSGCAADHFMLQHVKSGIDLNPDADNDTWKIDEMGHGTHVCGIVGARGNGLRGVAPDADIHVYKIFPKGDTFTLGAAIETAVAHGVDIINMSLTCGYSLDITEQLTAARAAGIACFVAAGNESKDVMFPAAQETVMAVGALGRINFVPPDSVSGMTLLPGSVTQNGYFIPNFTCFGNSLDFAGPGVGIISTVPGNALKVLDGTSMASPHIAGLAALYLAHDPQLTSMSRGQARLDRLYSLLRQRSNAMTYRSERVGNGMPLMGALEEAHGTVLASFFATRTSEKMRFWSSKDTIDRTGFDGYAN